MTGYNPRPNQPDIVNRVSIALSSAMRGLLLAGEPFDDSTRDLAYITALEEDRLVVLTEDQLEYLLAQKWNEGHHDGFDEGAQDASHQ